MEHTAPVTFSLDELWLLQSVVRHELPQMDTWRFPPASLALNDAIASAILSCHESGLREYTLALSRGDLLVLDALVAQDRRDLAGRNIGKDLLLRTFAARRLLEEGPPPPVAQEPDDTTAFQRLAAYKEAGAPRHPRRSRKLRKETS